MAGPGTVSFISNFINGYTGQMQQMHKEKEENVSRLMRIADAYRQKAMDPSLEPKEQEYYEGVFTEKMAEADKEANRKISGLGDLMKSMFGVGKGPKPTAGGGRIPVKAIESQYDSGGQGAPAAPGEQQGTGIPGFGENSLAQLVQNQEQYRQQSETPEDKYGGLNRIAQYNERVKDIASQRSIDQAQKEAQNQFEIDKQLEEFKQGLTDKERNEMANRYMNSPDFDNDPPEKQRRILEGIYSGKPINYQPNWQEVVEIGADGKLVKKMVDMNLESERTKERPYFGSASRQNEFMDLVNSGMSQDEANAELARRDALEQKYKEESNALNLENKELLAAARKARNEYEQKAKDGSFNKADAIRMRNDAYDWAKGQLAQSNERYWLQGAERDDWINKKAREYVEGSTSLPGIMTWEEMTSLINQQPVPTPEERGNNFLRGLQTTTPGEAPGAAPAPKPIPLPR